MSIRKYLKLIYLKFFDMINPIFYELYIMKYLNNNIRNNSKVYDILPGEKVLILAPHVDDESIGCGGAILKYIKNESSVNIVYLTDSGKRGSKENKKEIVLEREKEALKLADEIGLKHSEILFLYGEDGNLINSDLKEKLRQIIVNERPDTIFLPCLLDTHMDHFAVTVKLFELYKENLDLFKNVTLFLYESQSPLTVSYANSYLDITDIMHKKRRMLRIFESQGSRFGFSFFLNKMNGKVIGKNKFSEAFISIAAEEYFAFFDKYFKNLESYLMIKNNLVPYGESRHFIKSYLSSHKNKDLLLELYKI